MKSVADTYEVKVLVNSQTITLYYDRRYAEQAINKGKKYARRRHGHVEFCRKINRDKISDFGEIEKIELNQVPRRVKVSPYKSAIAMDEFIGQKRRLRRGNLIKDKENP